MSHFAWPGLLLSLLVQVPLAFAAAGPMPPEPPLEAPVWEVEGHGINPVYAKDDALRQAREVVISYLESLYGDISWQPTKEYLRQTGIARMVGDPREIRSHIVDKAFKVVMRVEVAPAHLREIQNLIREQRVAERHRLTALGLAGAVVLLLVLIGYLRLDELTKGYYTTALRLLALLLVGAAGAGFLWLIRISSSHGI